SSGMPSRNELAVLQSRDDATRPAGTRGVGGGALRVGRAASRLATATGRAVANWQARNTRRPAPAATKRERAAMRVRAEQSAVVGRAGRPCAPRRRPGWTGDGISF